MRSNQIRISALGGACVLFSMQGMTQIGVGAAPTDACAVLSQQDVATRLVQKSMPASTNSVQGTAVGPNQESRVPMLRCCR